jgi:AraC-like DNA-binding protein
MYSPYFTIVSQEFRSDFIQKAVALAGACLVLDYTLAMQHLDAILEGLGRLTAESSISFATRHVNVRLNNIPRHFHFDEYQIDYFVAGSGTIFTGSRWTEYSPGTFSFIPPQILHEITFPRSAGIDMYSIKFKLPHDSASAIPREAFVRQTAEEKRPIVLSFLKRIVGEFVMDIPASPNRLISLVALIEDIFNPNVSDRGLPSGGAEDSFVTQVKNIVLVSYSRQLRITEIARQIGISHEYLSRQFKKRAKQTLVSYINTQRLKLSMTMLQNTNMPIKAISANCGFKNVNYFTTMFKRFFSLTPKEVRKSVNSTRDQQFRV